MDVFPVSRLHERKIFYEQEFSTKRVESFFSLMPQFLHFDFGSRSRISQYPSKDNELLPPLLPSHVLKERAIRDVPESIKYDRNLYKDPKVCLSCLQFSRCFSCPFSNFLGQELVFDIPASIVKCTSCKFGQTCPSCVHLASSHAKSLASELSKEFSHVRIVMTGEGAQVHVDDLSARKLSFDERKELYRSFASRFPIRVPVSPDDRLSLLPYSLNGVVSRKVIPIKSVKDPVSSEHVLPSFLKKSYL